MTRQTLSVTLIIIAVAVAVALLPGCKRAQEDTAPPIVDHPDLGPGLEMPQVSEDLGITLTKAPERLVATFNEGPAMELTDRSNPLLRYTIHADRPGLPSRSPSSVADFETFIGMHNQGAVHDQGSFATEFGAASWASASYFEEDQGFDDLRVFAPHPSGDGTLIISAVGPEDSASLDDRLELIRTLLANLS